LWAWWQCWKGVGHIAQILEAGCGSDKVFTLFARFNGHVGW